MHKIFKYKLDITDEQTIEFPAGSRILSVIEQDNNLVVYALVNDGIDEIERKLFKIVGTGHSFWYTEQWTYLATVSTYDGNLVWHIFIRSWVE